MIRISSPAVIMTAVALLLFGVDLGFSATKDLPLVDGKPTLATVNGEPVTLEEFERLLGEIHADMTDNVTRSRSNSSQLLDRLINARLILQEARNIGLDELPEVQSAVNTFGDDTLRAMLYGYHVRNIREPDSKEVEKRYKDAVKEVKVISVLLEKEEDAKQLETEVRAGGDFGKLAQRLISAGKARGSAAGEYLKFTSLNPEVAKVISTMKKGEVSPLIRIGGRFSVVRLEGFRYPEDPTVRERVKKEALQAKKAAALKSYTEGLRKKYVTIDRKILDGIDYEKPNPGFEKLRTDGRVLARVKGEEPVTVGDLTEALEKKFFHGAEQAAREKKINKQKGEVLEEILNRRVTLKEAKIQKLDRTMFYTQKVEEYRNGVIFGTFVQKVVAPDVRVSEKELRAYYQTHLTDYTSPEMVRIDSLIFSGRTDAEEAIEKLRKGADFQWVRENAEGQVDAKERKSLPEFGGNMLDTTTLPDGVQKAISGAEEGDYRLYEDPAKVYYVLLIRNRVPPRPMPFESVKGIMGKKVYNDGLQKVLRDWEEKLRKASDVKIYATGPDLDRIITPGAR